MTNEPKIPGVLLSHLADMICGDGPYAEVFPHRSNSRLAKFFRDLWLDYSHDGSSRHTWVENLLYTIAHPVVNGVPDQSRLVLTPDLAKVIAYIVNPLHFQTSEERPKSTPGEALTVLNDLLSHTGLHVIQVEGSQEFITLPVAVLAAPAGRPTPTFSTEGVVIARPTVFKVPSLLGTSSSRCGVLMPFSPQFDEIYRQHLVVAIKAAGFEPLRADEMWKDSTIANDIFELVYSSAAIVADLSGRNPNVFYELGIAHTLGRQVVPIVQSDQDVPFDLRHHRFIQYDATTEGKKVLEGKVRERLQTIRASNVQK